MPNLSLPPANQRNGSIDLLRLVAACVIVLFHAHAPGEQFMVPAVAAFTAIASYNACAATIPLDLVNFGRKARRYLQPFAIWFLIYLALRLADGWISHETIATTLGSWLPPAGTMHQLWFLPFAFGIACAAPAIYQRLCIGLPSSLVFPLLLVFATSWLIIWQSLLLAPGLRVYGLFVPSAALGMALFVRRDRAFGPILALVVFATLGFGLRDRGIENSEQFYFGVPLVAAALALPLPGRIDTRFIAELSFATFLVHPLIIAILLRLTSFGPGTGALGFSALALSLAVGASVLALPVRRWLL